MSSVPLHKHCVYNQESTYMSAHTCRQHTWQHVQHETSIVWHEVPRCASTTLKRVFAHLNFIECEDLSESKDFFRVIFVRHPTRRLLSQFRHAVRTYRRVNLERRDRDKIINVGAPTFESYERFVCNLKPPESGKMDHHWFPMSAYVPDGVELSDLFFIGNADELKTEFTRMNEVLTEKHGVSVHNHGDVQRRDRWLPSRYFKNGSLVLHKNKTEPLAGVDIEPMNGDYETVWRMLSRKAKDNFMSIYEKDFVLWDEYLSRK